MDLLLTLGHNSSAIGISNGKIINGYEQERLTRTKSSSAFPIDAIKNIIGSGRANKILISHWYDDFDFYKKTAANETFKRHYNNEFIKGLGGEVIALGKEFTHHDAHAYSAIAFLESKATATQLKSGMPFHIIVSDGFGNGQEVVSIYKGNYGNTINHPNLHLVRRIYGYQNSLGLLYQYATSFCGMKENEDEYKFLGYESHITEYCNQIQINYIQNSAYNFVYQWIDNTNKDESKSPIFDKTYINIDKLKEVKVNYHKVFQDMIDKMPGKPALNNFQTRVVIGNFIQTIIEKIYEGMITSYGIKNAIVVGGLHYNVKLNNAVMNAISGFFCAMPLAGDQGAAIGVYRKFVGRINLDSLLIGKRFQKINQNLHDGVEYPQTEDELIEKVSKFITSGGIAEVVRGNMEFGPRALCNTSTLAIPYQKNVDFINTINGRDTVMPMAPVIKEDNINEFFWPSQYQRVIGSDRYMIVTYDYKIDNIESMYEGVMHKYPLQDIYSGRPQIIDDKEFYIYKVMDNVENVNGCKALINTSYNVHGNPIVYSADDAIIDFEYQLSRVKELGLETDKVRLFIGK